MASGEKMGGKVDIVNVSGGGSSNGYTTGTCIRYLKQWMVGVYISTVDVGLIDGVGCTKERYFKERYVKNQRMFTIFIHNRALRASECACTCACIHVCMCALHAR